MERIFISHGRPEEAFARKLAQHLLDNGVEPWLALNAVQPGQAVARAVREAAASCDAAVLVLGPQEPSSWMRAEWSLLLDAHWRSKVQKLVAVLVDDAEPPGFLKEARIVQGSSSPEAWPSVFESVMSALRLGAVHDEPDVASRGELRERLRVLTEQVQALEPDDEEVMRLSMHLRNRLAHLSPTDLPAQDRAAVLQHLAALDLRLGNSAEAETLLREAVELLSREAPSERLASASYSLGVALLARDDTNAALEMFKQALKVSDHTAGPAHPLTAAAAYNLGWTLARVGREVDARSFLKRAVQAGTESLGPDHATVRAYREALEGLPG